MKNVNSFQIRSFLCLFVVMVLTSNVEAAGISSNGDIIGQVSVPLEQVYTINTSALPPSFGLEFQLTSPDNPGMKWTINMRMAGNRVVGGNIKGDICDPLAWSLINGTITKTNLDFAAIHTGTGSCANNVMMNTKRSGKLTFSGKYTWDYNTNPTSYNGVLTLVKYIPSNLNVPLDLEELVAGR